jgi:hypothetical protein
LPVPAQPGGNDTEQGGFAARRELNYIIYLLKSEELVESEKPPLSGIFVRLASAIHFT